MITNIKSVIAFLQLMVDAYFFISGKITESTFNQKVKERKDLYDRYINSEREEIRLQILRELEK